MTPEEMQRRVDEAESRAAEMERRYDETAVVMRGKQETLDAYARMNADVHRENMRFRDEISELRTEITRLERVIYE